MERLLEVPPLWDGRSRGSRRPERPAFEVGTRVQKEEGLSSGLNRSTESSSPPLSKRPRRPLPLPSPPGELRLLNPTRWAGLHGSLLARRHHPNLPREAPVTSHPRAQGPGRFRLLPEVGRPEPLAYGTRLQEEGTASPGAPPPALEHLGAGWVGV